MVKNASRTEEVYDYIENYIEEQEQSPTIREIGKVCGIGKSTVLYHLDRLEMQGRIIRAWYKSRSIQLPGQVITFDEITEAVYEAIQAHMAEEQIAPTQREIAATCHISKSIVHLHLKRLEEQGKIEVKSGHRGIRLIVT